MTDNTDILSLKMKWDLDYARRKVEYDQYVENLRIQRERFYAENPDFPYKCMFLNVLAPPTKFTINIIT